MRAENYMSAEDYRHKITGARSKYSGQKFEDRIEAALNFYAQHGVLKATKTPEPMKPIKSMRDGRFLAVYTKSAQVDFSGTLLGGRSVRFEAKQTDTDRFQRSRLTDEQMDDLREHEKLGALCFVLLSFRDENFFRVPWCVWDTMKETFGRQYVKESDLEPYRLKEWNGIIGIIDGISLEGGRDEWKDTR